MNNSPGALPKCRRMASCRTPTPSGGRNPPLPSKTRMANLELQLSPQILAQHAQPVGTERLALRSLQRFADRHELAADDFLGLELERAVVHEPEHANIGDRRRVLIAKGE